MFLLFNVLIAKHKFTSEKLELFIICYILLLDTRLSQNMCCVQKNSKNIEGAMTIFGQSTVG